MKESALAGVVLIVALFLFCGFLANIGIFDAIDGREQRTEQLHAAKLKETQAHAAAQATREALRINQELHNAALEQERQRIQIEQEKQRATLYANSGAYARAVADTVKPLGFALLWLGVPLAIVARLWQRRRPMLTPQLLGSATTALERVIVDVERSRAHGLANKSPDTLSTTYAPKLTYQNKQDIQGADQLPAPIRAPSFRRLLESGKIGEGQPVLLGIEGDKALTGGWDDLYSAAIAGLTGSGKTTTTRFLTGQAALHGARFAVVDTHVGKGKESLLYTIEPLRPRFQWVATQFSEVPDLAALVDSELDRRTRPGSTDHYLFFVLIEEFSALMKQPAIERTLAPLIERIAQEGRGFKMYVFALGQVWQATRSGGTELRASLPSAYVHRSKREIARLLLPSDIAIQAPTLPTGAAVLSRADGSIATVTIPNTTAADMVTIGGMIATSKPLQSNFYATSNDPTEAPLEVEVVPPRRASEVEQKRPTIEGEAPSKRPQSLEGTLSLSEARERAQVEQLIKEGASMTRIVREVWGATGGGAFTEGREKYQAHRDALGL